MYLLMKNSMMWGAGGISEHSTIEFASKSKKKLKNILKEYFLKALENNDVEYINNEHIDEDRICSIDEEDFDKYNFLDIQYKSDGFDITADKYFILSINNVKSINDIYVCKTCGQVFGPYTDVELEKYGEEELWSHIQLDHEKEFEEVEDLDTPIMIEECYEVKEESI